MTASILFTETHQTGEKVWVQIKGMVAVAISEEQAAGDTEDLAATPEEAQQPGAVVAISVAALASS